MCLSASWVSMWPGEPSPDCNQGTAMRASWPKGKKTQTCKVLCRKLLQELMTTNLGGHERNSPTPAYVSASTLSICPSSYPFFHHCPSVHLSTHTSSFCLLIHPFIHHPQCFCPSADHSSIHLSIISPPTHLSIHSSIHPSSTQDPLCVRHCIGTGRASWILALCSQVHSSAYRTDFQLLSTQITIK